MPARRSSHTLFNLPAWALVGLIVISGSGFMSINSTNFDPAHDCPDCQVQFDPDNPDHYGLWGPYWHLTVKDGYMGCSGYGCILYEQQKDTYEPNGGDCGTCEGKVTGLTLQYLGEAPAQISILQKKGPTVYDELVTPGWAFSIDGVDKHDTLGTEHQDPHQLLDGHRPGDGQWRLRGGGRRQPEGRVALPHRSPAWRR